MKVEDIKGGHVVNDRRELEAILLRRHGNDINSFWLSYEGRDFPTLLILVKAGVAALHYLPAEKDAGFRSVGGMCARERIGTTSFSISENPGDDLEVLNDAVLPFSVMLSVANEFLLSDRLPTTIEWLRL